MITKRTFTLFLYGSLLLLLAGCQLQLPDGTMMTNGAIADGQAEVMSETAMEEDVAEDEAVADEGEAATEEVAEEMSEEEAAPEPAAEAATEEMVVEPASPTVSIVAASLRVRSGPGTNYDVLGAVNQGESYLITGQAYDCGWFTIAHPTLRGAWISGGADFVQSNVACSTVAAAEIPPVPAAAPPATAPAESQPVAEQPAPATNDQDPGNDLPADKGCYLLQNQLGPELTFTFTGDGGFSDVIKVRSDQDVPYCLYPGKYRVTVDAPPPWSELNEVINVVAGEALYFPIRPR